jgi:hypothetical protein
MSVENGRGPTPLEEAFQKLTTTIEAPKSGVRLLVRRAAEYEILAATEGLPTAMMNQTEALEYVKGLDPEGRRDIASRSQEVHDKLLCLLVLSPRLSMEEPPIEGSLPISLLRADRDFVLAKVLEFSRIGSAPPRDVPEPGPAPGPEVPAEQFRGGDPPGAGDGGSLRSEPVGSGEAQPS